MGLETGTYVEDLVVTNPPGGDAKSQGDDHLRLIKTVLRNTFKRASKAASFPGSVSKSANYTVLSTDDNLTILCDTTASFTLTLPTLVIGDAGWQIYVVKTTTDANPVFIAPPSGTINGYSKVRRSVEFVATRVMWTGSVYVATRPFGTPIGSSVDYHGSTLPNGHVWADGNSFTAANYVELNTILGGNTAPDLRGRSSFGRDNMGVGAAGRITNAAVSGVTGTTLGSSGGAETITIAQAQLPASGVSGTTNNQSADHTHSGTTGAGSAHSHSAFIGDDGHTHDVRWVRGDAASGASSSLSYNVGNNLNTAAVGTSFVNKVTQDGADTALSKAASVKVRSTAGSAATADNKTADESAHTHGFGTGIQSANHNHTFTTNNLGSGNAVNNMPPTLIVNKIVVAE